MIFKDTPTRSDDIKKYVKAWTKQRINAAHPTKRKDVNRSTIPVNEFTTAAIELHSKLYQDLDSLDNKAGVVANTVAIVIALHGLLIGIAEINKTPLHTPTLLLFGFLVSFTGAVFCMIVVWVTWSTTDEHEGCSFEPAVERMLRQRSIRTIAHRFSVACLVVALLIFGTYALRALTC
jgi:hypothetical protein